MVGKGMYIASVSLCMCAWDQEYSESELQAIVDEIVTEAREILDADNKYVGYGFYYADPPAPIGATIDFYEEGKMSELLHLQVNNGWEMNSDEESPEKSSGEDERSVCEIYDYDYSYNLFGNEYGKFTNPIVQFDSVDDAKERWLDYIRDDIDGFFFDPVLQRRYNDNHQLADF